MEFDANKILNMTESFSGVKVTRVQGVKKKTIWKYQSIFLLPIVF